MDMTDQTKEQSRLLSKGAAFRSQISKWNGPPKPAQEGLSAQEALSADEVNLLSQNVFLNNVLEALDHPFYVVDVRNYRVILANSAAYLEAPSENETCYALIHNLEAPCSGKGHICPLEEIKKIKKPITTEHIRYDKDGNQRYFEVHGHPLFDSQGNVTQIIEYTIDITKRKKSEEALRESEERYRILFDEAPVGYHELDGAGRIVRVNRTELNMLGYEAEDMLGRHVWDFLDEEEKDASRRKVRAKLEGTAQEGRAFERTYLRKDGTRIPVLIEDRRLGNDSGQPPGIRSTLQDITERKRAEESARNAHQELLEQQTHEKEHAQAELAKIKDELVRKTRLAAIGQVSASIAHDVRNPLGAIRNAAYYLKRRNPNQESEVTEYLDIIDDEVNAADRIITNLLQLARAQKPVKLELDLGALIETVRETCRSPASVQWQIRLHPDPFLATADENQLRQVLINICNNAVEAMKGKGEIIIEATQGKEEDEIIIRDTGPGVSEKVRGTLFEPLVTTKPGGTGLGLTISAQIMGIHGGQIECIEDNQAGTGIRIRLPREKTDPEVLED
jgi:PAS domain S-box-containing protein